MPRDGSGVASQPAGTTAVADTTIESNKYNSVVSDIYSVINDVNPESIDINGGAIDGAIIGANSAAAGTFTDITGTGTATLATVDINAGAIDGTTIGGSSAAAGTFTTITATTSASITGVDGTSEGLTLTNTAGESVTMAFASASANAAFEITYTGGTAVSMADTGILTVKDIVITG